MDVESPVSGQSCMTVAAMVMAGTADSAAEVWAEAAAPMKRAKMDIFSCFMLSVFGGIPFAVECPIGGNGFGIDGQVVGEKGVSGTVAMIIIDPAAPADGIRGGNEVDSLVGHVCRKRTIDKNEWAVARIAAA